MSEPLFVNNTVALNSPTDKVWNPLVNHAETKKYMFGCDTVSDWKKGSEFCGEVGMKVRK